jgi:hypothetical protein
MSKQDKYIYVKWFDTTYQHGELTKDCVETVGIYLGEGKRHITLAMDSMGDEYYRHICHIPKVNIMKKRYL